MSFPPKMLYNPKSVKVEFMCGGQIYIFEPGEKRILDGFECYHALHETKTGLVEYDGQDSNASAAPLNDMPWRSLVSLGSSLGIFVPGMSRAALVNAIKEKDAEKTGALREPTKEETA